MKAPFNKATTKSKPSHKLQLQITINTKITFIKVEEGQKMLIILMRRMMRCKMKRMMIMLNLMLNQEQQLRKCNCSL